MKTKNSKSYIRIDRDFLDLPEIEYTVEHLKGVGFAMVIFVLERLQYRKNAIGMIKNLGKIAQKLGVQKRTLVDMLCKCPVFRVDMERGIFYAPMLRRRMKLAALPSEDEINDVLSNGNIFVMTDEKCAPKAETSAKESKSFSKRFQKSASQLPDNQQKQGRSISISKSINISSRNIKDKSNNKAQGKESPCTTVAADVKEFKKILSSEPWARAVYRRTGINLGDERTLRMFARWMCDYCLSINKRLRDADDVRCYASNLLRKDTKTRKEFDAYMSDNQLKTVTVPKEPPHSQFEFVHHGMRFTNQGQVVPVDAPFPTSATQYFSYIHNRWVERSDYDEPSENAVLDRKMKENPGYVRYVQAG